MELYRVYGSKTKEYYLTITAASPQEAYDKAAAGDIQWFEVETDDFVEPYNVELDESNKLFQPLLGE